MPESIPEITAQLVDLISGYTKLKQYFEQARESIEADRVMMRAEMQAEFQKMRDEIRSNSKTELRSASGAFVAVNDTSVSISNGKGATIELSGNSVAINKDGLVIT